MGVKQILNRCKYIFLFLLFFSFSCRNNRSKSKIKAVIPLCNQRLFAEKYEVWGGGAYDGDMISAYLTDSTNFRIYLRTYDNAHEGIAFDCKGKDSVSIYFQVMDSATNKFKIASTTVYSLSELRKKKEFE